MSEYVHILDAGIPHHTMITLYRVVGIPGSKLYPNKLVAEIAVRRYFPDEDPDKRYARIFSVNYIHEGGYD